VFFVAPGVGIAMSVRSAFYVLQIVLALGLLVIVVVFGAIFALAYRNRRGGFNYFAPGDNNAQVQRPQGASRTLS
jgi:hypothetical protein